MPKRVITKRLGEVLLERRVIDRKQLEKALEHQKKSGGGMIGQVLIKLGFVTEEEVALALTAQYGFPYLPLANYELDEALMELVPEKMAEQYCLIPIDRIGNALTLAMADPSNVKAIEDVELATKCNVQTFVSTSSDIGVAIAKYYRHETGNTAESADGTPADGQNKHPNA